MGRPRTAQHGTRSRYTGGCRCDACRAANAAYQVAWDLRVGRKKYGAEEWERIRPKAEDNSHGTRGRYAGGCRCRACRIGNRIAHFEWRERALERSVPDHVHGTTGGYSNWGCRCEDCKAAQAGKNRRRKRSKAGVLTTSDD